MRASTVWAITVAQAALPTTESLKMMTLRPHFRVEPFAMEPMIGNIIDFTWDARGRMWAVETNDYPNKVLPEGTPGSDRVLILEDTNRDGKIDKWETYENGAIKTVAFDENGDGFADRRLTYAQSSLVSIESQPDARGQFASRIAVK